MVIVFWDRSQAADAESYRIYRANKYQGPYEEIAVVDHPTSYYVDDDGELYHFYRVETVFTDGRTEPRGGTISAHELALCAEVRYFMWEYLALPVYEEQGLVDADRRTVRFAYSNWYRNAPVTIRRNNTVIDTGYILYFDGTVEVTQPLQPGEALYASYRFGIINQSDILQAVMIALQEFNAQPPVTQYTCTTLPEYYEPAVIYGAIVILLERIILALQQREKSVIFGTEQNNLDSSQTQQALRELMNHYMTKLERLYTAKRFGPYPTTVAVVAPAYTLPGGRARWFRLLFSLT